MYVLHYSNNQLISFFTHIDITIQFSFNFPTIDLNKLVFDCAKRYDSHLSFYVKFVEIASIVDKIHQILVIEIDNFIKIFFKYYFLL